MSIKWISNSKLVGKFASEVEARAAEMIEEGKNVVDLSLGLALVRYGSPEYHEGSKNESGWSVLHSFEQGGVIFLVVARE